MTFSTSPISRPATHRARPPRRGRPWRTGLAVLLMLGALVPQQDARAQTPLPVSSPSAVGTPPVVSSPSAIGTPSVASNGELPLRAWHFAEGNSRSGFQTYFTLVNLADQSASVTAQYSRDDGIRLTQWLGIEPRARLSLNANDVVGQRAFGASFFADQDVVVERTTTWGPGQNGETVGGFAPDGRKGWYFAEGTTRGGAATYFVTQNLTDAPAAITATFTREDGRAEKRPYWLAPRARDAFRVNDLMQDTAFSAQFRSDQDVVVERTIMTEGDRQPTARRSRDDKDRGNGRTDEGLAMLSNSVGILGGLGYPSTASEPGARSWQFAEGSTRAPYQTTFAIFNPGQQGTEVRLQFRLEHGGTRAQTIHLGGLGRTVFDPRDLVNLADFATSITAERPIVVERTYASSGDGLYGALGYTTPPARSDSRAWFFAEGNTTGQTETFFILFNLSPTSSQIRASYFSDDGSVVNQTLDIGAGARVAVRANDTVPGRFFSARFLSDQAFMVERTLYMPGGSGFTTVGTGVGRP